MFFILNCIVSLNPICTTFYNFFTNKSFSISPSLRSTKLFSLKLKNESIKLTAAYVKPFHLNCITTAQL